MRNRIHGSGTMAGASIRKKRKGLSLNLTAHINSRERVSFRRYKSLAASKRVSCQMFVRGDTISIGKTVGKRITNRSNECLIRCTK